MRSKQTTQPYACHAKTTTRQFAPRANTKAASPPAANAPRSRHGEAPRSLPGLSGWSVAEDASGIGGLDTLTNGGLPRGRPTLICGGAGSGKTLFAVQCLVHGALEENEPGVILAFEDNAEE